ncbi:carbohydrate ABC transporter permease [Kitasatospora sp. NPDC096147]|uniref:carbohydrate ABC transporter permease n=1 Tax=Kitasatospora sp. NPDC096147 TaxID=3364093 RepID=UPI003817478C
MPFTVPAIGLYALFTLYPLARSIPLSLTDSTGGPTANDVGLANYRTMYGSEDVRTALLHTIVYTVVVVVAQTALGVAIAAVLRRWGTYGKVLSVVLLTPALLSPVMASFIWSSLYQGDGLVNSTLESLGLGGLTQVWLGDPATALYAIAVVNVWMFAGFSAAIFAAGFRGIPDELLEAAELDGAGRWTRFRRIEWPLLAPALTVSVTLSLTGCLRVLELPLVMTNGGPANSTRTLGLLIYQQLFTQGSVGYGTAIAVLLLVLVVVAATAVNSLLRRREGRI